MPHNFDFQKYRIKLNATVGIPSLFIICLFDAAFYCFCLQSKLASLISKNSPFAVQLRWRKAHILSTTSACNLIACRSIWERGVASIYSLRAKDFSKSTTERKFSNNKWIDPTHSPYNRLLKIASTAISQKIRQRQRTNPQYPSLFHHVQWTFQTNSDLQQIASKTILQEIHIFVPLFWVTSGKAGLLGLQL